MLDVRTLLIVYVAVTATLSLVMLLAWVRHRGTPGLGLWALGIGASAVGILAAALRDTGVSYAVSVIFNNGLVGLSCLLIWNGLRAYYGRAPQWIWPLSILGGYTAYLALDVFTVDEIETRLVLSALFTGLYAWASAAEAFRGTGDRRERIDQITGGVFLMIGVGAFARGADAAFASEIVSLFNATPLSSFHFLIAVAGSTIACFCLLMMAGDRYRQQLELRGRDLERLAADRDRAAEAAELANRTKSEFLATVSHEIRTPVNAVLGGLEILSATGLDERQRQCVQVMGKAGNSLLTLLDDLLDFTRIEAGGLTLEQADFDLHQRLRDIHELMTPRAAEKGLALALEIGEDVPVHISGDSARLRQILLNLVGNAVKFTDRGSVAIRVTDCGAAGQGRRRLAFAVADTGIGIPREKLDGIFGVFTQADGSIARRFGGAGLGLAICRRLAGMMGGDISVDSAEGAGSTFRVELPVTVAPAPEPTGEPAQDLPSWSDSPLLLLVEDEAVNRFVAVQLLERHGFRVVTANDGNQALQIVARQPVDGILMDLGMPGMDGFETTRRIRALPGPAARLPVIALTANVMPETIARCREAGMQGFISKPIRLPVLLRKLAEVVAPDIGAAPVAAPAEPARLQSLRGELGDVVVDALLSRAREAMRDALTTLPAAMERADRAEVAAIAHRLVGTLMTIGLEQPVAAMRRLELVMGGDEPDRSAGGAELAAALAALRTALADPTLSQACAAVGANAAE